MTPSPATLPAPGTAAPPPGSALIECVDLVRIFSSDGVEVQALQGLNLRVEAGELTAIVGASGSGKSTLLNILSGLDVPTAGSARIAGHDLLALRPAERTRYRRRTVGFVWQQTGRNLLPYLSVGENVAAALAVARSPRGGRAARIRELMLALDIAELEHRLPLALSGGQRQRAALAVAMANEPTVLLADEPTGELDAVTSARVLEVMRGLNERLGVTVLIVTHDQGVADHVRRTVQIRDGRTSTEVLRSTRRDAEGVETHIAEEFAVLDRAGRLQLPSDMVDTLALRDRVRLQLERDHVQVHRTAGDDAGDGDDPDAAPAPRDPGASTEEERP